MALTRVHGFDFALHPEQDPCDAPCNNVATALSTCTSSVNSFACACPTVVASGLACSSCLASVDADATDAAVLGSIYNICKTTATGTAKAPDPCDAPCNNVVSALSMCTSSANSFACVCPTVVASGLACSSCLASVDADATDASFLGSLHNRCAATGTATTIDLCDAPCNDVVSALSTCTASADSFACACPTVVASGLACSSCLASVDADATDASFFGSLYTRCKSSTTMNAALTSTPTTRPTVPKTTTSTTGNSIATHPYTQSVSGAHRLGPEMLAAGYIQIIMLILMIAGFIGVFM